MDYNSLKGKNVLITGASSDIGAAIAKKFASQGANVGLHYFKGKEKIDKLIEELKKEYNQIVVKSYELNLEQEKLQLVHDFVKDFGRIDILVNNAGLLDGVSFFDMTAEQFNRMFAINSRAPYLLSKDAFEYMKQAGKGGRIINISSIAIKYGRGRNNSIQYAGSKAALDALTTGLAVLGAEYNILVNSVMPSVIMTESQKHREGLQKRVDLIPLKRAGQPEEVANLVVYLTSEEASFITGQIFKISGGE